jgi:hypothetical protein
VCNLGCDIDLWHEIGINIVKNIDYHHPDTAISVWPGKPHELDQWMGTGLIDAAITQRPTNHENQSIHQLLDEALILVSTRPNSPSRFDPGYIYVDFGEEFGRHHTAAYSDAGIARVSFGCSAWALDFLLKRGGSAYLPESSVKPLLTAGTLHLVSDAPMFSRTTYLVTDNTASSGWPWLKEISKWLEVLQSL